jgi:hypothetical protein
MQGRRTAACDFAAELASRYSTVSIGADKQAVVDTHFETICHCIAVADPLDLG